MKPPTTNQPINMLIGDEEQNGKQVQGSWVGVPLPFLSVFQFYSSSPISTSVARVGAGGFVLSLSVLLKSEGNLVG